MRTNYLAGLIQLGFMHTGCYTILQYSIVGLQLASYRLKGAHLQQFSPSWSRPTKKTSTIKRPPQTQAL